MTPSRSSLFRAAVAALLCTAALACSGGDGGDGRSAAGSSSATTEARNDVVYPGRSWARADAASLGFDQAELDGIAGRAEAAGSNCLLVTRKGKVAGEWYWNGGTATSAQEVFSATKSYGSTLVGIAQADGRLDIGDKASKYIRAWRGTPSDDVTIENILANDSGRELSPAVDYGQLPFAQDMDALAIGLKQTDKPGTRWGYNNSAIQTLDAVLREATGESPAEYAADRLLGPIGMAHSQMTTDASGNTKVFMGLQSTCEDMARFGYLFLRHGRWDGTQVVPSDWVEAATGQPSQPLNAAYGYLWWLNRPGAIAGAGQAVTGQAAAGRRDAQIVPGAPDDMFFALGLGGQTIAVDPGSETVVVRLGPARGPAGGPTFGAADAAAVVTEALTGRG
jgi:CubicO group peptidase (beta-lactamase class C family)